MRDQVVKDFVKEFLEPSFRYLVKNGLENTSVRDLCKAMGISYGSLYYWFEGKDDIYISVVKYGIKKVTGRLFATAFEKMNDPKMFFATFLENVKEYGPELRLVFQFATSPEYGKVIRDEAEEFKATYEKYIAELAAIIGCSQEQMAPIVYMLISIVVDYAIWDDIEASQTQMNFLYNIMTGLIEN